MSFLISPEAYHPNRFKGERRKSNMENLYLDVGKERQEQIVRELCQRIGLTSRELATALHWGRSSLFTYLNGRHRMPYRCLIQLCKLAKVDVNKYSLKFIEINNKPKWEPLDLSCVGEEDFFQTLNSEDWQKVAAVGFLTDGNCRLKKSEDKYMLSFASCDKTMHAFFQKLVLVAFNENRSSFLKEKHKNLWMTYYQRSVNNPMVRKLFHFSKTYHTGQPDNPSLDFLLNEREEVKIQALRFAMSCEGSVSIKNAKRGKTFALRLACAHPKLVVQWQRLFHDIGIYMNIDMDKATWSGVHGLASARKASFQSFAEIGGFLPTNTKVTNGNFIGFEKNEVLQKILNLLHSNIYLQGGLV